MKNNENLTRWGCSLFFYRFLEQPIRSKRKNLQSCQLIESRTHHCTSRAQLYPYSTKLRNQKSIKIIKLIAPNSRKVKFHFIKFNSNAFQRFRITNKSSNRQTFGLQGKQRILSLAFFGLIFAMQASNSIQANSIRQNM